MTIQSIIHIIFTGNWTYRSEILKSLLKPGSPGFWPSKNQTQVDNPMDKREIKGKANLTSCVLSRTLIEMMSLVAVGGSSSRGAMTDLFARKFSVFFFSIGVILWSKFDERQKRHDCHKPEYFECTIAVYWNAFVASEYEMRITKIGEG